MRSHRHVKESLFGFYVRTLHSYVHAPSQLKTRGQQKPDPKRALSKVYLRKAHKTPETWHKQDLMAFDTQKKVHTSPNFHNFNLELRVSTGYKLPI